MKFGLPACLASVALIAPAWLWSSHSAAILMAGVPLVFFCSLNAPEPWPALTALSANLAGLFALTFTEGLGRVLILLAMLGAWLALWAAERRIGAEELEQGRLRGRLQALERGRADLEYRRQIGQARREGLSARIQHLRRLTEIGGRFSGILEPAKLREAALAICGDLFPGRRARLTTFLPTDDTPPDVLDAWVVSRRQGLLVLDAPEDLRFDPLQIPRETRAVIAVPVLEENKPIGILRVESPQPNVFTPDDLRVLHLVAALAGVALDNLRMLRRLEELAITDGLTGLFTQKHFRERLEEECARALRFHQPVSVLLLDLDHFKRINDTYGHPVGDQALRLVSRILREALRDTDLAGRYGGEEFAAILPATPAPEAARIAEEIRRRMEESRPILNGHPLTITLSVGAATFPEDVDHPGKLLAEADRRLYEAKRAGRNRVVAAATR